MRITRHLPLRWPPQPLTLPQVRRGTQAYLVCTLTSHQLWESVPGSHLGTAPNPHHPFRRTRRCPSGWTQTHTTAEPANCRHGRPQRPRQAPQRRTGRRFRGRVPSSTLSHTALVLPISKEGEDSQPTELQNPSSPLRLLLEHRPSLHTREGTAGP